MRKIISKISSLLICLCITTYSIGQQVWPVQISGTMIGANSLDFSVYKSERANDIMFNVLFNDPVEPMLPVTLKLTIENSSGVLYQTDPNFFGPVINLTQGMMTAITGADLAPYLSPMALVGYNMTGMGAIEIPEGRYNICLEVIDQLRTIPVSNKFCINRNFELNQVPRLLYPSCASLIEKPQTQNFLFRWSPQHLGSSNSPVPVDYTLEIVQLPQGTTNANDAFDSSLKVFSINLMNMTSYPYSPIDPILEADVNYAWRITAKSMMYPTSKLFENDGKSEVCIFKLYDEDSPDVSVILDGNIGGSGATNNASPTECMVNSTDYGAVSSAGISEPMYNGEAVRLGYFDLEVTQATKEGSTYRGTGVIQFPMLKSRVNVNFTGVAINSDRRIYAAESIKAVTDPQFDLPSPMTSAMIPMEVDDAYINQLNVYYKDIGLDKKLSNYNLANPQTIDLPMAMDKENNPLISVNGIRFTPRNCYLDLVAYKPSGDGFTKFVGIGIEATPYGLKTGSELPYIESGTGGAISIVPLVDLTYVQSSDNKMTCDCNGYVDESLQTSLSLNPEYVTKSLDQSRVQLELLDDYTDISTYVGRIKIKDNITTKKGLNLRTNSSEIEGYLDLSETSKPSGLDIMKQEIDDEYLYMYRAHNDEGRFLALEEVKSSFPQLLNNQNSYQMNDGFVLIDQSGDEDFAYFKKEDQSIPILNTQKWMISEYQMEYFNLGWFTEIGLTTQVYGQTEGGYGSFKSIKAAPRSNPNEVKTISERKKLFGSYLGTLKLPLFKDVYSYSYESGGSSWFYIGGDINNTKVSGMAFQIDMPKETQNMDIWNAQFEFKDDRPDIRVTKARIADELLIVPYASLDGKLSINLSEQELASSVINSTPGILTQVKTTLGVTSVKFDLDDLGITDFILDPFSIPQERYTIGGIDLEAGTIKVGDQEKILGATELVYEEATDSKGERLGLRVNVYQEQKAAEFTFWAHDVNGQFAFEGVEIKVTDIKCECTSMIEFPTDLQWDDIIKDLYNEKWRSIEQDHDNYGSLSSLQYLESNQIWKSASMIAYKEEIIKNSVSGFPIIDDTNLYIPFLRQDIKVEEIDGKYVAKSSISDYDFVDFKDIDELEEGMLPLDITDQMNLLGIAENNIPDNARLLVTGFETADSDATWAAGKMELMLYYEVFQNETDLKMLRFVAGDIPIGPVSVDLTGIHLHQAVDVSHGEVFYSKGSGEQNAATGSYARIDCAGGFLGFNIQGQFKALFGNATASDGTVSALTKISSALEGSEDRSQSVFPFTLNTAEAPTHSLISFVAPIKTKLGDASWNFSQDGEGRHLKFVPGDEAEFEAYIDTDPNSSADGAPGAFQGIYFKKMAFELMGWSLSFPIENVFYSSGVGLNANYLKVDPVPKEEDARVDSWKYFMSKLEFIIEDNVFTKKTFMQGDLLVPLFAEDPWKEYEPGWITFEGTVDYDLVTKTPRCNFLTTDAMKDKLYAASFLELFGFNISQGKVDFIYNTTSKSFVASCEFAGFAEILITDFAKRQIWGNDVPASLDPIELHYDLFDFEKLKFQSNGLNCESKGKGSSLLNAGSWGTDKSSGFGLRPPSMIGFSITASNPEFICQGNDKYEFKFDIGVGVLTDVLQAKDQGSTIIGAGQASTPKRQSTLPTKGAKPGKMKGANIQSFGFSVDGTVGFEFLLTGDEQKFNSFKLYCLKGYLNVGPLNIEGGLNIIRSTGPAMEDDLTVVQKWGSKAFKGYFKVFVDDVFGVDMVGQFGYTKYRENSAPESSDYPYGFLDVMGIYAKGVPLFGAVSMYGIGGGFRFNMKNDWSKAGFDFPPITEAEASKASEKFKVVDNDECTVNATLLKAGAALSGTTFTPEKDVYGGNIKGVFGDASGKFMFWDIYADFQVRFNTTKLLHGLEITYGGLGAFLPQDVMLRHANNWAAMKIEGKYIHELGPPKIHGVTGLIGFRSTFPPKFMNAPEFIGIPKLNATENDWAQATFYADFENKKWRFRIGSWGDSQDPNPNRPRPASGLDMVGGEINSFGAMTKNPKIGAYLQMGYDVDGSPPPEVFFPDFEIFKNSKINVDDVRDQYTHSLEQGDGMIMGTHLDIEGGKSNFGPLYGSFSGAIGFDLNIRKNPIPCTDPSIGNNYGINGWYGQGLGYGWFSASAGVETPMGDFDFFDATGGMYLKAEGPRPFYLKGEMDLSYSVCNGIYEGTLNFPINVGESLSKTCPNIHEPPPIQSVPIFASSVPSIESQPPVVSPFVEILIATNMGIDAVQQLDGQDFKPTLDEFKLLLLSKGREIEVPVEPMEYAQDRKGIKVSPSTMLTTGETYEVRCKFSFYKRVNGKWELTKMTTPSGKIEPHIENIKIRFVAGELPDAIVPGMLESQAPGYNQRYWHKDYSETYLKFNQKLSGTAAGALFPTHSTINNKQVPNELVVKLTEYGISNGKPINEVMIPVPNYPTFEKITKEEAVKLTIQGQYTINQIKESQPISVDRVNFPSLADMDLTKGAIYRVQVIRKPLSSEISTTESKITLASGQILTTNNIDPTVALEVANKTKVIYEYHFAVSKYNNLNDKLKESKPTHSESKVLRKDANHPSEATVSWGSSSYVGTIFDVKDDYYLFNPTKEGFDQFDLDRLRKNLQFRQNDNYPLKNFVNDAIGHPNYSQLTNSMKRLSNTYSLANYMEAVGDLNIDNALRYKKWNNNFRNDGTPWGYNLSLPSTSKVRALSQNEINSKRVESYNPNATTSDRDPNFPNTAMLSHRKAYALMLQDLRSRITVNQSKMLWIAGDKSPGLWNLPPKSGPFGFYKATNDYYGIDLSYIKPNKVAANVGYEFAYYGNTSISLPKATNWSEINEQKVNPTNTDLIAILNPTRNFVGDTNTDNITNTQRVYANRPPIRDVKLLSSDKYYHIIHNNEALSMHWKESHGEHDEHYETKKFRILRNAARTIYLYSFERSAFLKLDGWYSDHPDVLWSPTNSIDGIELYHNETFMRPFYNCCPRRYGDKLYFPRNYGHGDLRKSSSVSKSLQFRELEEPVGTGAYWISAVSGSTRYYAGFDASKKKTIRENSGKQKFYFVKEGLYHRIRTKSGNKWYYLTAIRDQWSEWKPYYTSSSNKDQQLWTITYTPNRSNSSNFTFFNKAQQRFLMWNRGSTEWNVLTYRYDGGMDFEHYDDKSDLGIDFKLEKK